MDDAMKYMTFLFYFLRILKTCITFIPDNTFDMIGIFKKEYLRDFYEIGKTADKKYRFQPEIVRKYKKCINLMRRVPDTNVFKKYNGLNF